MLKCLKMADPVGLTKAGKIDVMLILGKGENTNPTAASLECTACFSIAASCMSLF